jgi:hypothetical protein
MKKQLESNVVAVNNCLKNTVQTMSYVTLLRNIHPRYRGDEARRLKEQGLITEWEAAEFITKRD